MVNSIHFKNEQNTTFRTPLAILTVRKMAQNMAIKYLNPWLKYR
jgi:hypothetical protein